MPYFEISKIPAQPVLSTNLFLFKKIYKIKYFNCISCILCFSLHLKLKGLLKLLQLRIQRSTTVALALNYDPIYISSCFFDIPESTLCFLQFILKSRCYCAFYRVSHPHLDTNSNFFWQPFQGFA